MNSLLFADELTHLGGLSNEEQLLALCPEEFKKQNPWSEVVATLLFFGGGTIGHWRWKTEYGPLRLRQYVRFEALLGTTLLPDEDRLAIAGWMLSEMLEEVPEYLPLNRST